MNLTDPNLPQLESVARALGPLCERFVFIGGCATGLLVTDPAASPVRATRDVDVVVEVASLVGYHALERQLEQAGFKHDRSPDAPVCRWIVGGCMLDVMPTDEDVLGSAIAGTTWRFAPLNRCDCRAAGRYDSSRRQCFWQRSWKHFMDEAAVTSLPVMTWKTLQSWSMVARSW